MSAQTTRRSLSRLAVCAALLLTAPLVTAGDRDGDGVDNATDNCVHVLNPGQWDADADGIGNRCDPDFNNNGIVDDYDLAYLRDRFYTRHPVADLNSDGRVDFADLAILKSYYGAAPGGVPRREAPRTLGGDPQIYLQPNAVVVVAEVGEVFSLDVIMDFSTVGTIGGGFDVAFDSSSMSFVGWTPAPVGDPDFARLPDVLDGLLSGIAVGEFNGISGVFNLGTLEFQRVAAGISQIEPQDTDSITGPFLDISTFKPIPVLYTGAEVTEEPTTDPSISVQPNTLDLGIVVPGDSVAAEIAISNVGIDDLVVDGVGVNDALAAPFELIADGCSGLTLAMEASCSLTVSFAPGGVGAFMDSFEIQSNDPAQPVAVVTVSGDGVAAPAPHIAYKFAGSPVDLGRVQLGEFGQRFVRLENVGTADLVIGSVGDSDALTEPFALTEDTCSGASLAPADVCRLRVRFEDELGSFEDSLNIPSNDADIPQLELVVVAEGIPQPPSDFGGTVRGLGAATLVSCINRTTGERVTRLLGTLGPYSCHNIGLTINEGDQVGVLLRGIAR